MPGMLEFSFIERGVYGQQNINKEILKERECLNCFYEYQKDKTNTEYQKQIIAEQINKHQHSLKILYRIKDNRYILKRNY